MPFMNLTSRIIGEAFLKFNAVDPNQSYYMYYVIILTVGLMIGSYLAIIFY